MNNLVVKQKFNIITYFSDSLHYVLQCYNTPVREVQDPSMLQPQEATVPKPQKKKPSAKRLPPF